VKMKVAPVELDTITGNEAVIACKKGGRRLKFSEETAYQALRLLLEVASAQV